MQHRDLWWPSCSTSAQAGTTRAGLFQFVSIAFCPGTRHHWKESGSNHFASSFQIFTHIYKIPNKPPEQLLLFQHLFTGDYFGVLLFDCVQYAHVSLLLMGPEQDTEL